MYLIHNVYGDCKFQYPAGGIYQFICDKHAVVKSNPWRHKSKLFNLITSRLQLTVYGGLYI